AVPRPKPTSATASDSCASGSSPLSRAVDSSARERADRRVVELSQRPFVREDGMRKRRSSTVLMLVKLVWRCLRCSTCVGLLLDPNVNTLGIRSRGRIVQTRPERAALTAVAASHLLLRVESNVSWRHRRVAPPFPLLPPLPSGIDVVVTCERAGVRFLGLHAATSRLSFRASLHGPVSCVPVYATVSMSRMMEKLIRFHCSHARAR